ncbi:DUF7519 family protein [Haloarchaeobius sp. DFWS5]|uniref:DUF7519 family protein n=1 Tax=Haloarchaeobius sp. DFWS5 TaxID=3446114 RepID=UPI003EBB5A7F
MSDYSFDDAPAEFSGRLAVGIAALASVVLGLAIGQASVVLLAVAGGGGIAYGANRLGESTSRDRAIGSVVFIVGSVGLIVALGAWKPSVAVAAVVGCAGLAVAVAGTEATTGIDESTVRSMGGTLSRSIVVLLGATVVTAAIHAGVFTAFATNAAKWAGFAVTASALAGFVSLQLELTALAVLAYKAGTALDTWFPDRQPGSQSNGLTNVGVDPKTVPAPVWVVLVLEAVAASIPGMAQLFDSMLAQTSTLGSVVGSLLTSWVPHAALGVAILVLSSVVFLRFCQQLFVRWVGAKPPETMAYGTGGAVVSLVVAVVTAIPPVVAYIEGLFGAESAFTASFATYGMGATFLGVTAGALIATLIVVPLVMFLLSMQFVPEETGGFAIGAMLLFVGGIAGALANAMPVAVFVAMAGAFLTWDLGLNATLVGREVGQVAETRRGEVVHAAGAVGVGLAAVVLSVLAIRFVVPGVDGFDLPQWRALSALALMLVSLVAFSRLATTDAPEDEVPTEGTSGQSDPQSGATRSPADD